MSEFDKKAKDWDTPENKKRSRAIAKSIKSNVSLSTEMSAFEYGCGTGLLSFALRSELGAITLADNSEGMLNVLRDKINSRSLDDMDAVKLDLSADPLPQKRFDIVYTMMTLHHIPNVQQVLGQFYKLLNPNGWLAVADLDKEDGSFHGPDADVHKGFDHDDLTAEAQKAGFSDIGFSDAYEMEEEVDGSEETQTFPIFLMTGRKR